MSTGVPESLNRYRERVERALEAALPLDTADGPEPLLLAMRHSVFAGGKRIRPILAFLTHEAAGGEGTGIDTVAAALEMIHTYSLIHDDLPCMDDDDLRRGLPTCHVAHGESTALLAGDALLTRGLARIAQAEGIDPETALRIVRLVGDAAGTAGMIGGQILDLAAEKTEVRSLSELETIHRMKTGALLSVSAVAGLLVAGGNQEDLHAIRLYADRLGLAFQVVDDLLDVTGEMGEMGKRVRKDVGRGKVTYPSIVGVERTKEIARELVEEGIASLPFDTADRLLARLARFVVDRTG